MSTGVPTPAAAPSREQRAASRETNPYRGPQPLTIDDRLFGRDKELAELESLLLSQRIVLLYAASGVGKTSLLQAGLCQTMRNRGFDVVDVVGFRTHTAFDAARQSNRYEAAVVAALGRPPGETRLLEVLDSELQTRQLFVLDQFEELFTVDRTDWPAKRAFMAALAEALDTPNRWAVIAFREEYVAEMDAFVDLFPGDLGTRIRLESLSAQEAVKAIVGPAEHQGVPFDIHLARDLARLLSTIVEVDGERSFHRQADAVEPIHLQLVCHRLWREWRKKFPTRDRITADDVASMGFIENIGDVERVLGEYYDEVIGDVSQEVGHERVIRDWFDTLIAANGHRAPAQEPPEKATAAMDEFEGRYLIRRALGAGPARYELAHDRMVRAVPEANRKRLSVLEPLYGEARKWSQNRHRREDLAPDAVDQLEVIARANPGLVSDEELGYIDRSRKEKDRRQRAARATLRRRLLGAAAVLVVAILALWGWSTWRSQGETERDREAIQRAGEALLVEELDSGLALQMAVDAADQVASKQQLPAQLRSVLHRFTAATPTLDVLRDDEGAALLSTAVVSAPGADVIATGAVDGTVLVSTGDQSSEPSRLEGLRAPVRQIAMATDGSVVAAVDAEGSWRIWERTSRWTEVEGPAGAVDALGTVRQVAIRPGGRTAFALSADGRRLVDLATGRSIDVPPSAGFTMGVDEIVLWTSEPGNGSSPLVVVDEVGAQSRPIVGSTPTAAAFSSGGERLIIGTQDGRVLDRFGQVAFRASESGHAAAVDSVAFVADDLVVSAAADGLILWSLEPSGPELRRRISNPSVAPVMIAPTATPTRVWALTEAGTVEQWAVKDGHRGRVEELVSSDGGLLTRGSDGSAVRWDTSTLTATAETFEGVGSAVGLAGRGDRHVLVDDDHAVVFEGRSELSRTPFELDGNVTAVALLDDATVVLGDDTGMVSIQSARRATSTRIDSAITAVAANEAGTEIAVGAADGRVILLGTDRLEELAAFPTSDGAIGGVAVLPASILDRDAPAGEEVIVAGDASGTVTVWLRSVATNPAARMTLAGSVLDIGGDPETRRIVAISTTGHVTVWQFVDGTPALNASIRRTRAVTAALIDDRVLWVGDDEGLVADVALSDADLIADGKRVSAWEPSSVQICERRGWLDDCPLDPDRADDLRAVRQVLRGSTATGVEDTARAVESSSAASGDRADQLAQLVQRYADAVDSKDWDELRLLTRRDDVEDAALELAYGDLDAYSAFYVGATESADGSARLSVGAVRSFTVEGVGHAVGSCETWVAHLADDPVWVEEVPEQTVQIVEHVDDLPTARDVFDDTLLASCQG